MYVSNVKQNLYKKGWQIDALIVKKVDEKDIFLYLGELQDVKMKIWFVTNWIHNADVWGQIDCQPNWWPRKLCIRYQMSKKKNW